jgi:hypothetical protein
MLHGKVRNNAVNNLFKKQKKHLFFLKNKIEAALTPETEVNTHPPMSFIAQYNIPRLNEPNGTSFTSMFQPHAVIWPTSINFIEGLFLASSAISCSTRSTVFNRFLRQRSNALTRSLVDAV